MRLIDEDGKPIGVMPSAQALGLARERNLDLVEVSPMVNPPVCKLMDYGRFKYEQSKRDNEARKHQKTTELKEIRMRPRTDEHDLAVKVHKIQEFLGDGDKVKVGVIFRGRELAHTELGRVLLDKVIAELKAVAVLERAPIMEGKMLSMIMAKAPGWTPSKKAAPQLRSRRRTDGPVADDELADDAGATSAKAQVPDEATVIATPTGETVGPEDMPTLTVEEAPQTASPVTQ